MSTRIASTYSLDHEIPQLGFLYTRFTFRLPHLTHFSYHTHPNGGIIHLDDYKPIQLLPSGQILYSTLIHLHVDARLPFIMFQAGCIICSSPNLRCFIGAKYYSRRQGPKIISPDFVLARCPKLEYFAGDGSYHNKELYGKR